MINSLSIGKYFLIYIPILFLMFAVSQLVAGLFLEFDFDWRMVLVQAIGFAIFFRIFHKVRKYTQQNWKNKHN